MLDYALMIPENEEQLKMLCLDFNHRLVDYRIVPNYMPFMWSGFDKDVEYKKYILDLDTEWIPYKYTIIPEYEYRVDDASIDFLTRDKYLRKENYTVDYHRGYSLTNKANVHLLPQELFDKMFWQRHDNHNDRNIIQEYL